jgi:hypothetical protein
LRSWQQASLSGMVVRRMSGWLLDYLLADWVIVLLLVVVVAGH